MRIVIADSDPRRRASIASSFPPSVETRQCAHPRSVRRILEDGEPAALVIGALRGGRAEALAAMQLAREAHPGIPIFYMSDTLPGMLLAREDRSNTAYLPYLLTGQEIADAVLDALLLAEPHS
jgi:hypothetical protein